MRSRDIQLNEGFVANSIEKSKQDQLRGREGGGGTSVVIVESWSNTHPSSLCSYVYGPDSLKFGQISF